MQVTIQIVTPYSANDDIDIPGGIKLQEIESCYLQDVSVPGGMPAVVEAKGDGNATLGTYVKLQASGKVLKCGRVLGDGDQLTAFGPLAGEVQGFGDGT